MSNTPDKRPTDAELGILRTLWRLGPSSVRQVLHAMSEERQIGYTTVLKLMQIMTDKGILERDASVRPQVFRPARSEGDTQDQMVGDLVDRLFSGSPDRLVMQALSSRPMSAEDRQRIRDLLDRLEDDG